MCRESGDVTTAITLATAATVAIGVTTAAAAVDAAVDAAVAAAVDAGGVRGAPEGRRLLLAQRGVCSVGPSPGPATLAVKCLCCV